MKYKGHLTITGVLLSVLFFNAHAQISAKPEPNSSVQGISEYLPKDTISSRKHTEAKFIQAIQGIPLIIPLPKESDPTLFLMPVLNSEKVRRVDRLYLVDCMQDGFRFDRDIYEIKWIVRADD